MTHSKLAEPSDWKGSGWSNWTKGPQATLVDIKQGDLLLVENKQFHARNIIRVLRLDQTGMNRPLFYATFVNPDDSEELRNPAEREFCVWDFELPEQYFIAFKL